MTEKDSNKLLFKVQGVGIDTSTVEFSLKPEEDIIYSAIITSIEANNDYMLLDYIKAFPGASLITTINTLEKAEIAVAGHLTSIGRDSIDLLVIDSNCDFNKYHDLIKSLLDSKLVGGIGIGKPKSIDKIKEIKDQLSDIIEVKYITLDICPLHFNYDIISKCDELGISIIGMNPFGGRLTSNAIIDSFTAPYLLGFISTYSEIVVLSGRDMYNSTQELSYVESLIGKETDNKYILKKNINKLYKPLKKMIYSSLRMKDVGTISYDSPEFIYSENELSLSFSEDVDICKRETRSEIENLVDELTKVISDLDTEDINYKAAILRYKITALLTTKYNNVSICKIGSNIYGISCAKYIEKKTSWFVRSNEIQTQSYILAFVKDNIIFNEIKSIEVG